MSKPFYNEEQVKVGDETYHLVLNFRALDCIEGLTGQSMTEILPQLSNPPHSLAAKLLWGLLREKHEGITLDEAAGIAFGENSGPVGVAMGSLISRAFNLGKSKDENPPKRRGKSKGSGKSGSR